MSADRAEQTGETEPSIRVLIVDDQALLRVGFSMLIGAQPGITVAGEAENGLQALEQIEALNPDVVLMDIRMPQLDGIEATKRAVATNPAVRIIMLTTFDLDEYAFAGIRAGASGFLLKDALPEDLVAAIRAVHGGDAVIAPRVTKRMMALIQGHTLAAPEVAGNDVAATGSQRAELRGSETDGATDGAASRAHEALSEREFEVFTAIGKGLNNKEIAETLFLSESTVKTHVGRILQKLELRDRVQAVILGYEIDRS